MTNLVPPSAPNNTLPIPSDHIVISYYDTLRSRTDNSENNAGMWCHQVLEELTTAGPLLNDRGTPMTPTKAIILKSAEQATELAMSHYDYTQTPAPGFIIDPERIRMNIHNGDTPTTIAELLSGSRWITFTPASTHALIYP